MECTKIQANVISIVHRDVNGKGPLNGLASPDMWATPAPLISNTESTSLRHGHVLGLPDAPLVARPSCPQLHIIDTQCACQDTMRAPRHCHVWPSFTHAKMQNKSVLMMLAATAAMGHHAFSGLARSHGRHFLSRRDGAK